jgi:formylmethanofuran dehydrogenase subunit E
MKSGFHLMLTTCLVLLLGVSFSDPAASDDKGPGSFTEADAEFYMPEAIFGFFRPGVEFHLVSIEIPDDRQPLVTFNLTDPAGAPLDIEGVLTPGPVHMIFMLDYVPQGEEQVVAYCPPPDVFFICYDFGGTYTTVDLGTYTYKFATVLPEDYDPDATHTLSSVAVREFDRDDPDFAVAGLEEAYVDNDVYNFVPSGSGTPVTRDIVTTETCNNCHNPLAFHPNGEMQEVQTCLHCHNPDSVFPSPEYSFNQLIHRVHSGNEPGVGEVHYPAELNDCQVCHTGGIPTEEMPMVASPNPVPTCDGSGKGMTEIVWGDAGNVEVRLNSADGKLFARSAGAGSAETGNWVTDGKAFILVDADNAETLQQTDVDLTVFGCAGNAPYTYGNPEGTVGAMHSNWMTRPSRDACGSCHVNIDWETGEGHAAGAQDSDEFCSFCHEADSGNEFDRSVKGAHTVTLASTDMAGVLVNIKQVTNTGPGQHPTVVFSLNDKHGPIDPASLSSLTLTLNGPNDDFDVNIRESASGGLTQVGTDWSYTFSTPVPMDAEGSYSVGYEGRIDRDLNGDGSTSTGERDAAENALVAVAVTDSEPMARRMIVDDAKCEACHSNLSLHGNNRKNANEYCQTCHMPAATDEEVRLEGEAEGIHFKYMIHKIHRGAALENLPYIVYGYRSSVHDYSDVHFPGDLRDCESCHLAGTYTVDAIPEGALPTHSPAAVIPDMEPVTATCLSCHDGDAAASHALANSSALGESCTTCHAEGKTYSVSRVHAR